MRTRARWLGALVLLVAVQVVIVVVVGSGVDRALAHGDGNAGARVWTLLVLGAVASVAFAAFALVLARRSMSQALRGLVASAQGKRGLRAALRLGDDTEIAGIAGSFNRMAEELDLALRSLAAERNRFEAVLETMAPAVVALDDEGRIITANRSARVLLGLPDPVDGQRLLELVRIPALHDLLERAADGTASAELKLPSTKKLVQARASGLGDGGTVLVADDVSEIRRLERIRRDFVANVSHELRTPISVIRANAETLLEGVLDSPEQARPFVEALYRHSDRITRLINELLDISRMEAGKHAITPEPIELTELVGDVVAGLENDAAAKRIELRSAVPAGVWASLDAKAGEQVLVNFVDNAIKYTPAGGHVEVAVAERGDQLRIEVRDDGPGIDPQHRSRIFERFYRVDPGRSREMGGTGLGLSIVKHLVEAMGGQLGVDPRSPHGSVFWFTAPVTSAPPDE